MTVTGRSALRFRGHVQLTAALCAALAAPAAAAAQEGIPLIEALRLTLERQPSILLQRRQVDVSRGNLDLQSGAFDLQLLANASRGRTRTPIAPSEQASSFNELVDDSTSYSVGVQQVFRTGTVATASTSFNRLTRNIPVPQNNSTTVALSVTQPLLRGLGRAATAAGERVAAIELEASNLDLRYAIESGVLFTAQAYWSYVAASRSYEIVQRSEGRFETLVEEADELVAADQIAASEVKQVRANLANRTASRISAEQALLEAQQRLGIATGLPYEEFSNLPPPTDGFPEVPDAITFGPIEEELFRRVAAARRADLEASQRRVESARAVEEAALNGLKPRLDLVVDLSFAGVNEDGLSRFLSAYADNFAGPSATASLVFEFPLRNRSAAGRLASSRGVTQQNEIATRDLGRTIDSSIKVALNDLRRSAERLQKSREASAIFESAVDDEKQKLQLGIGTVIDLIFTEDSLTQSLLQEVAAEQTFANALVRLRFETGTLIEGDEADPVALLESITTVPEPEPPIATALPEPPPPTRTPTPTAQGREETQATETGPTGVAAPGRPEAPEAEIATRAPRPLDSSADPGPAPAGDTSEAVAKPLVPADVPDETDEAGKSEQPAGMRPATASRAQPAADSGAHAATRVYEVVRQDRDGALAIRVPTDGVPACRVFFTEAPPLRLVLDIDGTESRPLFQRLEVGVGPVRRVRVGQHSAEPVPVVRVVVDLDERVAHHIETDATGLTIHFEGQNAGTQAGLEMRSEQVRHAPLSNTPSATGI